jgi:hypothetical protein
MLRWLTTILARLTRRRPSAPLPRVGWNGRPWVGATEDKLSPDPKPPATDYSTLIVFLPGDGSAPTRAPARRAR